MKKVMRNILIGGVASLGVLIIMSSANYNNTINKENEKFLNVKSTEEIQVLFNEEKNNREKGYSAIHWLDATEEDINEQAEKMAKLVSEEIAPEGEKFVANDGITLIHKATKIQDFYNSSDDKSLIYALDEELKTLEYNDDIVKQYKCLYLINQVQGEIAYEQANQISNNGCTLILDELGLDYIKNIATIKKSIEDNLIRIYKEK